VEDEIFVLAALSDLSIKFVFLARNYVTFFFDYKWKRLGSHFSTVFGCHKTFYGEICSASPVRI